jgi:hypothetical protein
MTDDVVWMRLGDGDDYHAFVDLDAVADLLAEFGIGLVERYCLYGVCAAGFEGHNYISLYWGPDPGDGSAEASRELTDDELVELQRTLASRSAR